MKIVVFKGKFQYGVVDLFIDEIVKELEKKVDEVIVCNLLEENIMNKLIEIFSTKLIDCVIAFNGIGVDIKINNNQSLYDVINTNFLAIYVDHPAHLIQRVIEPIKNYLISFVDKEHIDYVNEIQQQNHKISFFLPHGGFIGNQVEINDLDTYVKVKKIEILFTGTYMGDAKRVWENNNFLPNKLIEKVCEKLIYDDYSSIHKTFYEIFDKEGIKFSQISKAQLSKLFVQIITYVRQYKRNILIERIAQSGLNITICGRNWDSFVSKYNNIDYKGELDINDTLKLIGKSKILINASPNFTNGSHERVFSGMLNQSVVFTDKSSYYDEYFEDEKNILYYSFNSLEKDINKLKNFLTDNKKLYNMSFDAYDIVIKSHTWRNRVDKILEIIQLSKEMDR